MPRSRQPLLYPVPEGLTTNRLMNLARLSGSDAGRYIAAGGLPVDVADRVAVGLGSHIDVMWPEVAWVDAWIEDQLDELRAWVARWNRRRP